MESEKRFVRPMQKRRNHSLDSTDVRKSYASTAPARFSCPVNYKSTNFEDSSTLDIHDRQLSRSLSDCIAEDNQKNTEPQFKMLSTKYSRSRGVLVLPVGNFPSHAVSRTHPVSTVLDNGTFSNTTQNSSDEIITDRKVKENILPTTSLNLPTAENCRTPETQLEVEHLSRLLNTTIQSLRPVKYNREAVPPKPAQLRTIQNTDLPTETFDNKGENFDKQRVEDRERPVTNIDPGPVRTPEISVTSNDKDKYLENSEDNMWKINYLSPRLPQNGKSRDMKVLSYHHYETIDDETEMQFSVKNNQSLSLPKRKDDKNEVLQTNSDKNRVHLDKLCKLDTENLRYEGFCIKVTSAGSETYKANTFEDKEQNDDEKRDFDQIWKSYKDRPLLPLKLNQKQRSLSCTNLVQTIKALSKRNSADNSRHLSIEAGLKTFQFKREFSISEADISKDCPTEEAQLDDLKPPREGKILETLATKNYSWYHPINAKEASKKLLSMQQNGVFLIRPARNPTKDIPHTLCVVHAGCVYNMYIRYLENGLIALGKKKDREKTFSSELEMIRHHQTVPISIQLPQSGKVAQVYLLITPPK